MKTTVEREGPTKVKLLVEVEPLEVERLTAETIRRMSLNLKIPGFRKGKVPRQIIESRMGREAIRQRVIEESLPELYGQATRQESLRPIANPEIEITGFDADTLEFEAVVEVRPDIKLPNYKDMEVVRPSTKATQEEIDDRLDVLRKRFATLEPIARAAEPGDHVLVDIRASIHDQPVPEATTDDFMYEVGSQTLAPEMDEEVTGKRAGDILKFNTTLPQRLSAEHGGQEVTMTVIVKEVNAKRLPGLDDDFAKTASEFDTLGELEDEVRNRIEEYKSVQADREVTNRLLDELVDITEVPVPDSLIDAEAKLRIDAIEREAGQHGLTLQAYLDINKMTELEFRAAQRTAAERSIAADFLLDDIAKAEGMKAFQAEIEDEIKKMAKRLGKTPAEMGSELRESGRVEALAGDILRRKVLDYLVGQAKITDEDGEATPEISS